MDSRGICSVPDLKRLEWKKIKRGLFLTLMIKTL